MLSQLCFFVSIAFSFITWGIVAARYIWPALRDRQPAEALRPLLMLHTLRKRERRPLGRQADKLHQHRAGRSLGPNRIAPDSPIRISNLRLQIWPAHTSGRSERVFSDLCVEPGGKARKPDHAAAVRRLGSNGVTRNCPSAATLGFGSTFTILACSEVGANGIGT
jgi:hypothetical protein